VTSGGYNSSDDIIDEFTVQGPAITADTTPPVVAITNPAANATVSGTVQVTANATDNVAMSAVQFQVDGANVGAAVSSGGPTYTYSWDTTTVANGTHTLSAVASDTSGNKAAATLSVSVSNTYAVGQRITLSTATNVYASIGGAVAGSQPAGATGTLSQGPSSANGTTWWLTSFDTGVSGWITDNTFTQVPPFTITPNTWVTLTPIFDSTPGQLYPQGWVNRAAYDPSTHRILFSDRWYDSVRGTSIFANGIYAFDPWSTKFSVLKLNNWYATPEPCPDGSTGCYTTLPLPANATDPTPPDHHPLSGLELVPEENALYTVNGVNSYLQDPTILNATWRLDLSTNTWQQVSTYKTDPNYPPNIGGAPSGLVYDPVAKVLVQFVPSSCGCKGTATYLFDPAAVTWTAVPQDTTSQNVYVAGAGTAYDSKRDVILAFGGNNFITNPATTQLWAYSVSNNLWSRLADAPFPAMAVAFAYDSNHDVFLALGGNNTGNNTYLYNPSTNQWSQYPATLIRPPQLSQWQAMAYDPAYDVFVFEGGTTNAPFVAMFRYDPLTPPTLTIDTGAPTVVFTAPQSGQIVAGRVTVTVYASDTIIPNTTDPVGVVAVQLSLDGAPLGGIIPSSGGSQYTVSWDTTRNTNGNHVLSATAYDAVGNSATATIPVTINNITPPPVLSGVTVTSVTATQAIVSWTTDAASDSQVAFGTTSSYGSLSLLGVPPVKTHAVYLTGLNPSTTYHYQAMSRNLGGTGVSADLTFTTAAAGTDPSILLQIKGEPTEVTGVTNGSTVTPTIAPPGFTGTVITSGNGSVNFAPAQVGNGVFFLSCCDNSNDAYYQFPGSNVGNVVSASQGRVTFYLVSRYSFASRVATAASGRMAFDVHDDNVNANVHLMYFRTQVASGFLAFSYTVSGVAQYYYVPTGLEDTLFGNGVILKVTITWSSGTMNLYLNDSLVQSTGFTPAVPNWSAKSAFSLGAADYGALGGYGSCDDIIDEFTILQN
jgi:hypothetical protein